MNTDVLREAFGESSEESLKILGKQRTHTLRRLHREERKRRHGKKTEKLLCLEQRACDDTLELMRAEVRDRDGGFSSLKCDQKETGE